METTIRAPRTARILVRMTVAELQAVTDAATARGLTLADYVRETLLHPLAVTVRSRIVARASAATDGHPLAGAGDDAPRLMK